MWGASPSRLSTMPATWSRVGPNATSSTWPPLSAGWVPTSLCTRVALGVGKGRGTRSGWWLSRHLYPCWAGPWPGALPPTAAPTCTSNISNGCRGGGRADRWPLARTLSIGRSPTSRSTGSGTQGSNWVRLRCLRGGSTSAVDASWPWDGATACSPLTRRCCASSRATALPFGRGWRWS